MTWFRNLGIARKLAVAFTLTTAMTLALGAFALVRLAEAHAQLLDISSNWMPEIVTSVQRVTDIMAEISAASQEQSAGIEQVNLTITQMDETTQQNAALVEEATAAARSMEEQAGELGQAVATFRLRA